MLMQRAHILIRTHDPVKAGYTAGHRLWRKLRGRVCLARTRTGSRGRLMTTPQIARGYGPRSLPMIAAQALVAAVYVLRGQVQP